MEPPSSPPAAPLEVTLADTLLMGLGILLGLCGSVMINIGNNVQALGMGMEAAQKDLDEKERSKRPKVLWTTGTVTFIVGSVINFVAFVFAAASVLAPLEAIQFVSNLVFARFVTKVPVSRKMVGGSALIVAGTIGAVAGGPLTVTSFTIAQLQGFWESPAWIAYVAFAWVASLSMQAFWEVQTRRVRAGGKPCGPPALLPILYAVSSALIGTQSVVQAKVFSELMELWLGSGVNIWVAWYTYATLAYFLVTVAFWLYRLNAALAKYDPLFIIPLLQASYIVLATVAGGLYFQEFAAMVWWQLLTFAGCIGVMFVGLALLMPPITGASAPELVPEEEEGDGVAEDSVKSSTSRNSGTTPGGTRASGWDSVRQSRRVTVTGSVSFANHPAYRASVAARSSERRASQVAAGIQDIYGGAGAGIALSRRSFSAPLPALTTSFVGALRRSSSRPDKKTNSNNLAESTEIVIQMPQVVEVSERDTFASPEYSKKQSQKEFRRIAGGSSEKRLSATSPPSTPMPPMTPPSIGEKPSV